MFVKFAIFSDVVECVSTGGKWIELDTLREVQNTAITKLQKYGKCVHCFAKKRNLSTRKTLCRPRNTS